MPLASSNDLILAGIQDIVHALHHPSPASPLAPLTDSHHRALTQLTSLITSIVAPPTNHLSPSLLPDAIPDLVPPPADVPLPAAPLRVPSPAASSPPRPQVLVSGPTNATPAPSTRTVHFAPLPSATRLATFRNSTGIRGTRRRRGKRHQPAPKPLSAAKTVHPRKTARTISPPAPRAPPTHRHGTRANSRPLQHVAASARPLCLAASQAATVHTSSPYDSPTTSRPADTTPAVLHCAFHGNAFNPDTGKLAEYRELSQCSEGPLWQASNADKIGRLAQGYGTVKGTNTMFFIPISAMPKDRKATYLRVVSAFRPEKENPRRVRWTVGGNKVDYPFDVSTKTADLTTAKLLFNSVLSTPNAKFMATDLKDFYLGTPMTRYEYMRIPLFMLPAAIIEQYNL